MDVAVEATMGQVAAKWESSRYRGEDAKTPRQESVAQREQFVG